MKLHEHNSTFFAKESRLSCYWAGFIAADGCVDNHTNHSLSIGLAEKDVNHLHQFKHDIQYSGPILYRAKTRSYSVRIYSAHQLLYDLENTFNIVDRKSLILKPPCEITDMDLIKCYIAGYIDGDGCIKYCKRDKSIILDVFTGSIKLIKWIKYILEDTYNLPDKKIYSYGNGHTYRLQGKNAIIVINDLKNITPRMLIRKWSKLDIINKNIG